MKNKAKLLLAISTLSAVVLAAGVTSTFAWFTTQSLVQAKSGTLTVKSPSTLSIKGYDLVKGADLTANKTSGATLVTGSEANLGAVSSPWGKTFYAPDDWTAQTPSMVPVASVTKNPYVGYIQYSLAVTAAKGEDGKYLKAYVTVTETNAGDPDEDSLAKWYRVGLYHVETKSSVANAGTGGYSEDPKHSAGDPSNATTAKAVYSHSGGSGEKYYDGSTEKTDRASLAIGEGNALSSAPKTNPTAPGDFVFETKKSEDVVAHFVVAVWMDGYAGEKQNVAGNQSIVVTANFELI